MDDLIATGYGWLWLARDLACLTALFGVLARLTPCNPGMYWWKNLRAVWADFFYWFVAPLFTQWARTCMLVAGIVLLFGGRDPECLPVKHLPFWQQCLAVLLVQDVFLYASHRFFHSRLAWGFHAVHHSPAVLDWTSTSRFHPVNILLGSAAADVLVLLLGFPSQILFAMAPFNLVYSAMVHANLNWTFGPFRYVLASPVFHRWHHTTRKEGIDKNFASTFPVLDLLFGTFYMPAGRLPDQYGNGEHDFPEGFFGQLLHPFRQMRPAAALGWLRARPAVGCLLLACLLAGGAGLYHTARLAGQNARFAHEAELARSGQHESLSALRALQLDAAQRAWVQNDLASAEAALDALAGAPGESFQQQRLRELCRRKRLVLRGRGRALTCVALSPDGDLAASGGEDGVVGVYDARTGQARFSLAAHERAVRGLAFLAGGRTLASASFDGLVKVWDLDTHQEVRRLGGGAGAVLWMAASGDGRRVVASCADLTARLYDPAAGREVARLRDLKAATPCVALDGDGGRVLAAGGPAAQLYDPATGKELLTLAGHGNLVYAVAVSPDGGRLVTGSFDHTVKVWDAGGQEKLSLEGHAGPVYAVAVCDAAGRVVSGGKDGLVKVWDGRTGQERLSLRGHTGAVTGVAVSRDGGRILSGGADGTLTLWNARNCSPGAALELTRSD
jgi:sterol desaturase/sphingolipid hydroxylase (fatty acid hydroxylase superfamily)